MVLKKASLQAVRFITFVFEVNDQRKFPIFGTRESNSIFRSCNGFAIPV